MILLFHGYAPGVLGNDGCLFFVGKNISDLHLGFILGNKFPVFRNDIFIMNHFSMFNTYFAHIGIFFRLADVDHTADLSHNSFAFRHLAGFEDFLHTRETGCNIGSAL